MKLVKLIVLLGLMATFSSCNCFKCIKGKGKAKKAVCCNSPNCSKKKSACKTCAAGLPCTECKKK